MGDSLQEQLLALGLAKKAAQADQRQDKNKETAGRSGRPGSRKSSAEKPRSPRPANPAAESELSLKEAYNLLEKQTREESERALMQKRAEQRRRRQLNQSVRAIVDLHRLNDPAADLSRNFLHKGRIRKVSVTAEQLKALNGGSLGLVYLAGGYHILPTELVEQVRNLSAEHVADLTGADEEDGQYPVPDDLHW